MTRIPALSREEAPPEARAAYDRNLDAHGVVLNSTGIYAYRPMIQAGAGALARGVAESGLLPPRVKVLVNLRVAALAGCPF